MKKLTKASVEALKNEMPVLEKNELEAVKGGGTVYCTCGSGEIGWDGVNDSNLYVMDVDGFHKYSSEHCGMFNITSWGAVTLDKASEHLQATYVRDIMQQANLLNNGASVVFVEGSGGIGGYIDENDNMVYSINYGDSTISNKDDLLRALDQAHMNAVIIANGMDYCGGWNKLP